MRPVSKRSALVQARPHTKGFTLLELALVLALIGLLISICGPNYSRVLLRGRTMEARAMLDAIAAAERAHFRDHGSYLACAPSSAAVPKGTRGAFDLAAPGWRDLGVRAEGPVYYKYQVKLDGAGFVAQAEGDLDGDGVTSRFTLDGRTLKLKVENELE